MLSLRFKPICQVLKDVEHEIQEILPEFQELMLAMKWVMLLKPPRSTVSLTHVQRHSPDSADAPIIISPDTVSLHKQLVTLFTQYDTLTKRIRGQPCEQGSNQERLQNAIARASSAFVAKEAGILQVSGSSIQVPGTASDHIFSVYFSQALPQLQKQRHRRAKSSLAASVVSGDSTPLASEAGSLLAPFTASKLSVEDDLAVMLQPLLEQEAQIE